MLGEQEMPEEPGISDPYEVVLRDLYAERDKINSAIAALEALRSSVGGTAAGSAAGASGTAPKQEPGGGHDLLGMSIVDAAKKLLAAKRKPLRNPDIATLFKEGGLVLNSREPANTIGSVLTRRFMEVGDVVRVDRGTWGLKEWYPNRSFKTAARAESAPSPEPPKKEHWKTREKREREEAAKGRVGPIGS
jgi:hypothetical protein